MGKHISEGKIPPIFWYGELRQGSLFQHVYALFFTVFGYSIFLLRFLPLLFFFAFLAVQFLFLKEIFSQEFAFVCCLLYVVPVCHIGDWLSLDIASGFSLMLFLGTLILYLTYLLYYRNRDHVLPILGFLYGVAFWTHQITVGFIITSLFFVVLKYKLAWKKHIHLFLMACMGSFPLLLSEVFSNFALTKYLLSGEGEAFKLAKIEKFGEMLISLLSRVDNPLNVVFLILLILGLVTLIILSIRKRTLLPHSLYGIFFIVFSLIFLFSGFSSQLRIHRYLFPLFVSLPILIFVPFELIKKKVKYIFMLFIFLLLFFFNNARGILSEYEQAKEHHQRFKTVIASLKGTQIKYWMSRYIRSYVLNALSKEEVIVASYNIEKYFPYQLFYYNQNNDTNYIFLVKPEGGQETERATNLLRLLQYFDVKFTLIKTDLWWLFYDLEAMVLPITTQASVPENIPEVQLITHTISKDSLVLLFNTTGSGLQGYRLHVEIPGYSSRIRTLLPGKKDLTVRLPFPAQQTFPIHYYLDYMGIPAKTTRKKTSFSLPDRVLSVRKTSEDILYLAGFGPPKELFGKKWTVCQKKIDFQVNKQPKKGEKLVISLYSPFQFQAWYWYGNYVQKVKVYFNGTFLEEKELADGENVLSLQLPRSQKKGGKRIVTLEFAYSMPFPFARLWKTSALLERITLEKN